MDKVAVSASHAARGGVRSAPRPARWIAAAVGLVLSLVAVSPALADLPTACTQSAQTVTCTYTTAGEYQFNVPAGLNTISVDAIGGAGGGQISGAKGGEADQVTGEVSLPPSQQVLFVEVAGAGGSGAANGPGGFNGGGGRRERRDDRQQWRFLRRRGWGRLGHPHVLAHRLDVHADRRPQ